jgi:large subunit ribosomal protein L4
MKLSLYNVQGEIVGDVEVNDAVFGAEPNVPLMHQAVVQQLANRRVGTAATKTRAVVAGTTKKMYKQKGTGRARHGSRKVPLWTGGGVAHGPHPRSYEQHMPKKMRRAAIKSALSAKVRENQLVVLDSLAGFDQPRTKAMVELLGKLPVSGKVLLAMDAFQEAVVRSARNVPQLRTCAATALNTYDLLNNDYVVTTVPAIRQVETWLSTVRRHSRTVQAPKGEESAAGAAPAADAPAAAEGAVEPAVESSAEQAGRAPRARRTGSERGEAKEPIE